METHPPIEDLRSIYLESRVIAVVGASPDASKRANTVPSYLQDEGYRIIPVNPNHDRVLGEAAYPTLADIPESVDVVDVFRPANEAPHIAEQAAAIGAKVLWLQAGIVSDEAARIAADAGMTYVSDLCMGVTHARLGLGSGPSA
jgi:predicted CoA-binding protein